MNKKEINDLLISWITISVAFAWIGTRILGPGGADEFISQFVIVLIATGTGFILHELSHKYAAIHYGAHAEFRAWNQGLILAVALALISNGEFVFAAPGAVYVFGSHITAKQNGIISLAGPAMNLAVAIIFGIALSVFSPPKGFILDAIITTMHINLFLAAFNLLPISPLDGSKVARWNAGIWIAFILAAGAGVLLFPAIVSALYYF